MVTWGVTKFLHKDPTSGNLDQFGQKELVHVGSLVGHASNLWPKPARDKITRVKALTTQINLARMSPAQLEVFVEKQVGECMMPLPSEERIGPRKDLNRVHLWWKVKAFYWGHDEPCASLYQIEVSRTLARPKKACSLLCVHLW